MASGGVRCYRLGASGYAVPMAKPNHMPAWKKALLAPIPCILLLVLAEGFLALIGYRSPVNDPYESFVLHRPILEAGRRPDACKPGADEVLPRPDLSSTKPPDTFRIIAIGGSIVFGLGAANPTRVRSSPFSGNGFRLDIPLAAWR